jgi:hypothetical protein
VKPWVVILAALVIFGCGAVTGAMLSLRQHSGSAMAETVAPGKERGVAPLPPIQRADFLRRMERRLDLSAQQKERIEKIMHGSQERTKVFWDQIAPQMREETLKVREEIKAELTPEQQVKYEALLKPHARRDEDAKPQEKHHRNKPESTNNKPEPMTNKPDIGNKAEKTE